MKKPFIRYIYASLLAISSLTGCQKLDELNVNPNNPEEAHPQLLLTKVEWDAFRDYNGTTPLYITKMLVQTDGENTGQYYKWDRSDFDAYGKLRDVVKMQEEAERLNLSDYIALAKFFRAYYFYNLTLTFGDVPYTEALKGEETKAFTPAYDNQKSVLQGILQALEEANQLLAASDGAAIEGDIIHGKSPHKWQRTVNAFRLKVLLSLSKKAGDTDLNIQNTFTNIAQTQPLLENRADDAQLVFLNQEGNRYPQFNSSSFGSGMYMDSTFIKLLQDKQDPRLFAFCTQTRLAEEAGKAINDFSAYEGGDPAAPYAEVNLKAAAGRTSKVNERYYKDPTNEPLVLIGYAEQELILAEAILRGWIAGNAQSHYENAVKASFNFYETYATNYATYLTAEEAIDYLQKPANSWGTALNFEQQLQLIITQKYIQSYFQGGYSAFREHLRTGYPVFRRPNGVRIPYRWMYPQSEYNYNSEQVNAAIVRQFGEGNDNIHQITWWLE